MQAWVQHKQGKGGLRMGSNSHSVTCHIEQNKQYPYLAIHLDMFPFENNRQRSKSGSILQSASEAICSKVRILNTIHYKHTMNIYVTEKCKHHRNQVGDWYKSLDIRWISNMQTGHTG